MSQPGLPPQSHEKPQKPAPAQALPPGSGKVPPGGYTPPPPLGDNPYGMLAMVFGVISFPIGCPFSIAAIILGFIGRKKEPKWMATTGLILGIVTLTLSVLFGCLLLAIQGLGIGSIVALSIVVPPIHNAQTFQQKAAEFEARKSASGSYPSEAEGSAMMAGTRDGWGHPIVYRRDGEAYILVSPGPDGILDNADDVTFEAREYDPDSETGFSDASPTEQEILKACQLVQAQYDASDDILYPSDAQGQALIDHLKDEWGNTLVYRRTEDGDWFEAASKGPDGILGTFDDVTSEQIFQQMDDQ